MAFFFDSGQPLFPAARADQTHILVDQRRELLIGGNVLAQITVILRRDLLAHPAHVGDSGFF